MMPVNLGSALSAVPGPGGGGTDGRTVPDPLEPRLRRPAALSETVPGQLSDTTGASLSSGSGWRASRSRKIGNITHFSS